MQRRSLLRAGVLGFPGLALADALRLRAGEGTQAKRAMPNAILIWLDGGPSHLDMFDLKPDAPAEVRGEFRPIDTNVPGVRICEHFRSLASRMDKVCLIRSMTSELGEHNFAAKYLLSGYKPSPVLDYPSLGSVRAKVGPKPDALPAYIGVPQAPTHGGPGYLGGAAGPFSVGGDPSKPDFRVRDLEPATGIDADRLLRRKADREAADRRLEGTGGSVTAARDAHFSQAYGMILSPKTRQAFDLKGERDVLRDKYGRHTLGQSCLLARRLVEAGCPFVSVNDPGWDTHQTISRALKEGYVGGYAGKIPKLDQALSALLDDLSASGRLSDTLVMVMGEFGRTPKLNTSAGRDHWPRAFSVLLAGAGVRAGTVVGSSDSRGESAADRPVSPADLVRTIHTLLGIDPDAELLTADGRPVRIAMGETIREVIG